MALPTTLVVPGADYSASPPMWVLPTSVAPSFVGIFGGSQVRSLANGAAFGLPPGVATGEMPAIQPGYMTTQGWNVSTSKQAGIALPAAFNPGTAYSLAWVCRVNTAYTTVVPILGDPGGNGGSLVIDYFAANNITYRQRTVTQSMISSPTLPGAGTLWNAFLATAQQGVGQSVYLLTNGSAVVSTVADATNFVTNTTFFCGGGGSTNATTFPGAGDIALMILWPSVLSAADRALAYAWIKAWCAKNSITV